MLEIFNLIDEVSTLDMPICSLIISS